jgi:hypothetical protein
MNIEIKTFLYFVAIGLCATYLLWIFFLVVMGLKRASDAGLLTKTAKVLGFPLLIIGFVLDVFVNFTVMTVVLFEIPQEFTVTSRLKRHNLFSTGWRKAVAKWVEPLLDPYDPSGDHI